MNVRNAMNRSVRAVTPGTKIMEVASLICLYCFHGLPVVDDAEHLIGVISEKDVLHSLFPTIDHLISEGMQSVDLGRQIGRYGEVLELNVEDLMAHEPISVDVYIHLLRAATVMVRKNFRRIPVVENELLVGKLSLSGVHKAIFHANITGSLKMQLNTRSQALSRRDARALTRGTARVRRSTAAGLGTAGRRVPAGNRRHAKGR